MNIIPIRMAGSTLSFSHSETNPVDAPSASLSVIMTSPNEIPLKFLSKKISEPEIMKKMMRRALIFSNLKSFHVSNDKISFISLMVLAHFSAFLFLIFSMLLLLSAVSVPSLPRIFLRLLRACGVFHLKIRSA